MVKGRQGRGSEREGLRSLQSLFAITTFPNIEKGHMEHENHMQIDYACKK